MIFNEISDKGGLTQVLMRRLNMTGSAPAPALMPEISPTLVLEAERPEWSYYKAETLFARYAAEGGGGANYTSMFLQAPAGMLLVVTSIYSALASGDIEVGWCDASPAYSITSIAPLYSADNAALFAQGSIFSGTTLASPSFSNVNDAALARHGQTLSSSIEGPFVMRNGGRGLLVRATGTNQTMRLTFKGYMRNLLPNELG